MSDAMKQISFPKTGHFWIDEGLLGFYELASREHPDKVNVSVAIDDKGVTVKGTEEDIQSYLQAIYTVLLERYYNTSSEKQEQEKAGFYYDSKKDTFVRFPKVKSRGIAGLIFSKAPRPMVREEKYVDAKKGLLPPEYAHLQERLNEYLASNNLKIGGKGLLLDGPNAYQPKVAISPKEGKKKGHCFLCGNSSHALSEIGGTVFPMISGSSGALNFNPGCTGPAKVCWKCDYIAKFVPVTGFYVADKNAIHMYFPYSTSFSKMHEMFRSFESMKIRDPYYLRNFNPDLGGYFTKSYEQFFSFLYSVYRRVLSTGNPDDSEGGSTSFDFEKMYDLTLSHAPLEFIVVHTEALGDTYMGKMIWPFREAVYIFRLFERLEKKGIILKQVMQILIDFDQKKGENKTLMRNRICERVLKQQGIVDLVDQHVFHVNTSKTVFIKPVLDFVIEYEKILGEEANSMKQELIDTAVSLGKTIGMKLGAEGKKGKGDLFRLRKARRPGDFLNEVNRIQMKYDAAVTADLYLKGEAFEQYFTEFKHFCMIAALNTYNAMNRRDEGKQNSS
jgi:hypothetical protein